MNTIRRSARQRKKLKKTKNQGSKKFREKESPLLGLKWNSFSKLGELLVRHINILLESGELEESATCAKFAQIRRKKITKYDTLSKPPPPLCPPVVKK
jgi:hypothetical protein